MQHCKNMVSLWLNLTLPPGSTAGGVIRGSVEFLLIATVGGGWTGTGTDDPPWDGFCSDSLTTCGWTGSTGRGLEVTSEDSSIGFVSPMGWYSISVWGSTMEGRNRYWIGTNYFPLTDLPITWESTELKSSGNAVPNILLVKIFNLLKTDRFSCYEKGQWLMMVVSFNAISAECEIASSSFPYCNSAKTFTPLLHSIIHFS